MVQGASGTKAVTHPLCELVALKSGSMFPGGKYKAITLISTSLQISFTDFNIVLRNKDHLKKSRPKRTKTSEPVDQRDKRS